MKDECAGIPPSEFVGLWSKMYSLLYDGIEKKTAKGIRKCVVRNIITHEDYKSTLLQKASQTHTMMQIRSYVGHAYRMQNQQGVQVLSPQPVMEYFVIIPKQIMMSRYCPQFG